MSSEDFQERMLEELRQIRKALEPKPAPPPPQPRGLWGEFMAFLNKYGIIGLAIAFIMGGAVGKLVSALVADIIMPFINPLTGGGDWRQYVLWLGPIPLALGDFAGALIDFLVIALVIFLLMRWLQRSPFR